MKNKKFINLYGLIFGITLNVIAFLIIGYGLFVCKGGSGCLAISLIPFAPVFILFSPLGLLRGIPLILITLIFYFAFGYLIAYIIYLVRRKKWRD